LNQLAQASAGQAQALGAGVAGGASNIASSIQFAKLLEAVKGGPGTSPTGSEDKMMEMLMGMFGG
jgi:hypothetical protein